MGDTVSHAFSLAATIALLLTALRAADLILTASQQEAVQRFCDDLALRLEYASIEHAYRSFRRKRWQAAIYLLPIAAQVWLLATTIQMVVVPRLEYAISALDVREPVVILRVIEFTLAILWIGMLAGVAWAMWHPTRRMFDWLLGTIPIPFADVRRMIWFLTLFLAVRLPSDLEKRVAQSGARKFNAPVELTGPVVIKTPKQREQAADELRTKLWLLDAGVTTSVGLPIEMTVLDISLLACVLIILGGVRLWLWFARKVMWRVATYSKGAWTAVVVLLTALLAVADVLVKTSP
jgi:hypothetical protein